MRRRPTLTVRDTASNPSNPAQTKNTGIRRPPPRSAGIVWPYRHEQEGGLDRRRGGLVVEFLVESGDLAAERHPKRALVAFVEPRAFDRVQAELAGHVGSPADRLEQRREAMPEIGLEHRRVV